MARPLISLVEIADVICEDVGDVTKRYRGYILRQLAREYGNLHRFVSNATEITTQVFPAENVINMPCDFLEVTKVGLMVDDRLVLIDRNYDVDEGHIQDINQSGAEAYINGALAPDYKPDVITPFYNYKGELVLNAYGRGVRCPGLYSVDRKNGTVILGSVFPKNVDVVIEYMSDGLSSGVSMVPSEMEPCLYNFGVYRYYQRKSDSRWRAFKEEYDASYYQLEMLYKFVPIDYIVKLFNQEMHTIDGRM